MFFLVVLTVLWVEAIAQIPSSALTSFEFLRSECLENTFLDSSDSNSIGNLIRSNINSSCLDSNGIGGFQVQSINNLTNHFSLLNDNALTLALWIQPQVTNSNFLIMGYNEMHHTSLQCRFNVLLSQGLFDPRTNTTEFMLQLCNNGVSTGNILTSGPVKIDILNGQASLLHLTLAVQYPVVLGGGFYVIGCQMFVNGDIYPRVGYVSSTKFVPSVWSKGDHVIFNPSTSGDGYSDVWSGKIFSFAVYPELADNNTLGRFYTPLSNSIPIVSSQWTTVQQNGEVGDHTNDPGFYQMPIPNSELPVIGLSCYDFDDQLINPLYNSSIGPTMKVFVNLVPQNDTGTLYYLNGTEIIPPPYDSYRIQIPYDIYSSSYSVRFRPPFDVYSIHGEMIANFSFYAVDGITGLSSMNVAWVSVNVSHVDRPPIATDIFNSDIVAERQTTLELIGQDQDSVIVAAEIVNCPTNGSLYMSNDGSALGNCSNNSTISVSYPFLRYKYTGSQGVMWNSTIVGSDTFAFCLIDSDGRRSVPATYSISVITSLEAIASPASWTTPSGKQEHLANISLFATDFADTPKNLMVRITRPPTNGRLLTEHGNTIQVGDCLPGVMIAGSLDGINANYIGNKFFFNVPNTAWNGTALSPSLDSFDFEVYSESGAISAAATQYVTVLNVNDRTDLGFKRNADGYLSVYQYGISSSDSHSTELILQGFSLLEFDKNVDVIRASVSTMYGGKLSLNKDYISMVDFSSLEFCFASGGVTCVGDGTLNNEMIFIGTPYEVELVLNGMTYQNMEAVTDYVNITVYDGVGGDCFLPSQPNSGSIFEGCFTSNVVIEVRVLENSGSVSGSVDHAINNRLFYIGLGLLLTIAIALCRCFIIRRRKPSFNKETTHKTGRALVPESDSEGELTGSGVDVGISIPNESKRVKKYDQDCHSTPTSESQRIGWTVHVHKNGKQFYYNARTRQSTWIRPDCVTALDFE